MINYLLKRNQINDEEFYSNIEKAINRQLVSDVEIGGFLSGGLDSSIITYLSQKNRNNYKVFTCGYNFTATKYEQTIDETDYAEEFAKRLNIEHYKKKIDCSEIIKDLNKMIYHMDEPRLVFFDSNYYAAELASTKVKVALSGCGGDELLLGYNWKYDFIYENKILKNIDEIIYERQQGIIKDEIKKEAYTSNFFQKYTTFDTRSQLKKLYEYGGKTDFIEKIYLLDLNFFLLGLLLVDDKLGMANSIEIRIPMLDKEFSEYVLSICYNDKYEYLNGKKPLRKYFNKIGFNEIASRPKQGFLSPWASWLRSEEMSEYFRNKIFKKKSFVNELLQKKFIEDCLEKHLKCQNNYSLRLWSILNLQLWFDIFVS